jgi:hypothetical protein
MGTAPITFTRRWQRCDASGAGCADIAGATGTSYVPVQDDLGRTLRAVVTATNEKGTASRASAASGTVVATGGYSPNASAQIAIQKAQGFVSLQAGETKNVGVSCPSGTRVVDGSPLVQSVDQDRGTRSDVLIRSSKADGDGGWTASVQNPTTGQAQVQLYASCVGTETGAGGRTSLSAPKNATVALEAGEVATKTLACAAGSIAIAPSFDLGDASGRIVSSEPAADGGSWSFAIRSAGDGSVDLGVRCLETGLSDGSRLVVASQSSTATIGGRDRRTTSIDVGDGRAAIAAGYTVPADGSVTMLGREPQNRTALYTYENTGGGDRAVSQTALVLAIVASTPDPDPTPAPAPAAAPAPSPAAPAAASDAAPAASTAPAAATVAAPDAGPTDQPVPSAAPAARAAPLTISAPRTVRAASLRKGLKVSVDLAKAGTVATVITDAGKRVASSLAKAKVGRSTVVVALPAKVRRQLGRAGHRSLRVKVTAAGVSTTTVVRVTR